MGWWMQEIWHHFDRGTRYIRMYIYIYICTYCVVEDSIAVLCTSLIAINHGGSKGKSSGV